MSPPIHCDTIIHYPTIITTAYKNWWFLDGEIPTLKYMFVILVIYTDYKYYTVWPEMDENKLDKSY